MRAGKFFKIGTLAVCILGCMALTACGDSMVSVGQGKYPRDTTQLRLSGERPAPGDLVFLVSRQLGALAPEGGDVFGAFRCGADGNKEHLCSDNKLIAADGTWGAVGCTASELSEYSDFSVYDPANAYARIYGVSFV